MGEGESGCPNVSVKQHDALDEESLAVQYLAHLPCGVLIIDHAGVIIYANENAADILLYTTKELEGMCVDQLVPHSVRDRHTQLRQSFAEQPTPRAMGAGKDLFAVTKSGSQVPVEIGISPVHKGDTLQVICCINDISERKKLEKKLEQYMEELERSNAELDTFAYTVSHDLKEPLRGMLTIAEFLREDCESALGEQGLSYLDRLEEQGYHMGTLIDTILSYSRLGRAEIQVERVEVSELVNAATKSLSVLIEENEVKVDMADDLPPIEGDATLLKELFLNLISNGIKYNNSDSKQIRIRFDQVQEAYIVEDNGVGIPSDQLEQVFQLFTRLKSEAKNASGSGIGMSIVKKIIDKHSGRVWIESEVGQGTRIYVALPRCLRDEYE